ncbi:MAG: hypothetical protein HY904_11525 [Deltaproteobacteria bacterium]|nr:hypothetical protein [Deltaproteobacteria bacterium]
MDELFVLEEEAQVAQFLANRAEHEVDAGHWHEAVTLVGRLVVLWKEALLPQMQRVLGPRARQDGMDQEVCQVLDAAGRVGSRLEDMRRALDATDHGERTRLGAHLLLDEVRGHLSALTRGVLPRIYGACTDDDLWDLARDLDRMVDEMGRSRWRGLVSQA